MSPILIVYCIPSSDLVLCVPERDRLLQWQRMETLLGKDRGESPRAGGSALSKASQEPSLDSGETYHLVGLRNDWVPLLSSGNWAIQDRNHSRLVLLSFVMNVTQLYLPSVLLFGSDHLSSCYQLTNSLKPQFKFWGEIETLFGSVHYHCSSH